MERRYLPAQAQHFIDVLLLPAVQELAVGLRHSAGGEFFPGAEGKVQPGVKGKGLPLCRKDRLQKLQKAKGTVPLGGGVGAVCFRIEHAPGHLVGVRQPALSRLQGDGVQQGTEGIQGPGTGDPAGNGLQGGGELCPGDAAQKPPRGLPADTQLFQE